MKHFTGVRRDIGGSILVWFLGSDEYIEVRRDVRYPGLSFVEYVRNGQVRQRHTWTDETAPRRIIALARGLSLSQGVLKYQPNMRVQVVPL